MTEFVPSDSGPLKLETFSLPQDKEPSDGGARVSSLRLAGAQSGNRESGLSPRSVSPTRARCIFLVSEAPGGSAPAAERVARKRPEKDRVSGLKLPRPPAGEGKLQAARGGRVTWWGASEGAPEFIQALLSDHRAEAPSPKRAGSRGEGRPGRGGGRKGRGGQ